MSLQTWCVQSSLLSSLKYLPRALGLSPHGWREPTVFVIPGLGASLLPDDRVEEPG